ncbi:cytochrome P450 [Flammula alnicola]|nr:cytochrome P450 [Flammula alnicola]
MGEMVFGGSNDLELMRNGDPEKLIPAGKMATAIVDSFGQAPWIIDVLWHLPSSKDIHRLRLLSANMMRNRVKKNNDVSIKDVASYLINGSNSSGEKIPMSDLEVESLVAIQGGSDNTAMTIALIFYFLLTNPSCFSRLQSELDKVFPDPTVPLNNEKLAGIPYAEACVTEALRLASPFFIPRIVPPKGCVIDGNFIPEGSVVALSAYSLQIDPQYFYPDPMAYRPERWLPDWDGPENITNKEAFVSFSSGPYGCVAKNFAMQEMRLVVSRLALTFDMSLPDIFDPKAFFNGFGNMRTSVFDRPLYVKAVRRSTKTKLEALAYSPI